MDKDLLLAYRACEVRIRKIGCESRQQVWMDALHDAYLCVRTAPRQLRQPRAYLMAMARRGVDKWRSSPEASAFAELRCSRCSPEDSALARLQIDRQFRDMDEATRHLFLKIHVMEEEVTAIDRGVFRRRMRLAVRPHRHRSPVAQ